MQAAGELDARRRALTEARSALTAKLEGLCAGGRRGVAFSAYRASRHRRRPIPRHRDRRRGVESGRRALRAAKAAAEPAQSTAATAAAAVTAASTAATVLRDRLATANELIRHGA